MTCWRNWATAWPPAPGWNGPKPSPTSTPLGWPASPRPPTAILKALAGQFAQTSTDSLENLYVFQTREVVRAGGLAALRALGQPAEVLWQTKARIFAV
jgi:hypothetical protein